MRSKIFIGVAACSGAACMWLALSFHQSLEKYPWMASLATSQYGWLLRLMVNMTGYSTVLLPMYILHKYLERINYFNKPVPSSGYLSRCLMACFYDAGERIPERAPASTAAGVETGRSRGLRLAGCALGLMGSYLVWGLLQEKIMTQDGGGPGDAAPGRAVAGAGEPAAGAAAGRGARRLALGRAAAQLLLLRAQQRAQCLVPVRGAPLRQLPHAGVVQILQSDPRHANGEAGLGQRVQTERVRHSGGDLSGHVHVRVGRQRALNGEGGGRRRGWRSAAGRLLGRGQLHQQLAGGAVLAPRGAGAAAHAGRRQPVLRSAVRRFSAAAALGAASGAGAAARPGLRRGPRAPLGQLGDRPAVYILDYIAVRRRRVYHHHDAATSDVYPPVVLGVRPPHLGSGSGRSPRSVLFRHTPAVLQAEDEAPRRYYLVISYY